MSLPLQTSFMHTKEKAVFAPSFSLRIQQFWNKQLPQGDHCAQQQTSPLGEASEPASILHVRRPCGCALALKSWRISICVKLARLGCAFDRAPPSLHELAIPTEVLAWTVERLPASSSRGPCMPAYGTGVTPTQQPAPSFSG